MTTSDPFTTQPRKRSRIEPTPAPSKTKREPPPTTDISYDDWRFRLQALYEDSR